MTEPTPVAPDSLAGNIIASGGAPVQPDLSAMQAQLDAMTAAYNKLMAERGIPADPVAAAVMDLSQHVAARTAAVPHTDYSRLTKAVKDLAAKTTVTAADVDKAQLEYDDIHTGTRTRHELDYIGELFRNLKRAVLSV